MQSRAGAARPLPVRKGRGSYSAWCFVEPSARLPLRLGAIGRLVCESGYPGLGLTKQAFAVVREPRAALKGAQCLIQCRVVAHKPARDVVQLGNGLFEIEVLNLRPAHWLPRQWVCHGLPSQSKSRPVSLMARRAMREVPPLALSGSI